VWCRRTVLLPLSMFQRRIVPFSCPVKSRIEAGKWTIHKGSDCRSCNMDKQDMSYTSQLRMVKSISCTLSQYCSCIYSWRVKILYYLVIPSIKFFLLIPLALVPTQLRCDLCAFMYLCVCVCGGRWVCARASVYLRDRQTDRGRERERERRSVSMCLSNLEIL
jgi:hypothetical protein